MFEIRLTYYTKQIIIIYKIKLSTQHADMKGEISAPQNLTFQSGLKEKHLFNCFGNWKIFDLLVVLMLLVLFTCNSRIETSALLSYKDAGSESR